MHDLHAKKLEAETSESEQREVNLKALRECIKSLPENSSRLVNEHYFAGRTATVIAQATGRAEGAVRMALLRIRLGLQQCIKQRALRDETAK